MERVVGASGGLQCWLGCSDRDSLSENERGEGSQPREHLWENHSQKRKEYAWCALGRARRPRGRVYTIRSAARGGLE